MRDGPPADSPHYPWLRWALLGWLGAMALLWLIYGSTVGAMRFSDPDDQLRLIEVRDLLAGQGWWDLTQYRIDPPHGVLMHWSRLVDVPIAALLLVLTPLLGQHGAELAALVIVPALTLLGIVLLLGRLASRMVSRSAYGFALFALLFALPLLVQVRPLRIDHHAWQIVAALAAMNGLIARDARKGGWTIGAALAIWLSISMEALPITVAFFAVMALRWLCDAAAGARFLAAIQSLAVVSLGLALISRNPADLVTHCDSISPMHLAIFVWCALASTAVARFARKPVHILAGLAAVGAAGMAILLTWAPQCTGGGFNELGPVLERLWYREVIEGQPVWHNRLPIALQFTVPAIVGLFSALAIARRSRGAARERWTDYALILAACLASGIAVSRTSAYAGALALLPLGVLFAGLLQRARTAPTRPLQLAGMLGLGLGTLAVLAPALPASLIGARIGAQWTRPQTAQLAGCRIDAAMPVVRGLPRGVIFSQLNIGPELLLGSPHSVVATAHHRAPEAMRDVFEALMVRPDAARALVNKHHADYVMLCLDFPEIERAAKEAPDGLAASLRAGQSPDWLEPIALPKDTRLMAWRVKR